MEGFDFESCKGRCRVDGYRLDDALRWRDPELGEPRITRLKDISIGRYANLLVDKVFKKIFGARGNKDILISFLNMLINDVEITDLDYVDKEFPGLSREAKTSVFDVYCTTSDGRHVTVEMQEHYQADFADRSVFYSALPITMSHPAGESDWELDRFYYIAITDFALRDEPKECLEEGLVSRYSLRNDLTGRKLTSAMQLIFYEIGRQDSSRVPTADSSLLEKMAYALGNMSILRERPVELQEDVFRRLFEVCEIAAMDSESTRQYIINAMTTELDIRCQMKAQYEFGLKKGEKKGRIYIAEKMLSMGMTTEMIREATGLKADEINQVLKKTNPDTSLPESQK